MDFKTKYFKYKYKYLCLKKKNNIKQVGGGGFEKYCDICGGPLHSNGFKLNNLEKYQKYFDNIERENPEFFEYEYNDEGLISFLYNSGNFPNNILRLKDGVQSSDVYSINELEGDILKDFVDNDKFEKIKKYDWLNDLVLLHWSGKIIKIEDADSWENYYTDKKGNTYSIGVPITDDKPKLQFIMHNDCYKLTKSMYGDYNSLNIWSDFNTNRGSIMKSIYENEYGSYNRQEILWFKYFYLGDDYLLESPLKNSLNKERILNINFNIHKEYNPIMFKLLSIYENNNGNFSKEESTFINNEYSTSIFQYEKGNMNDKINKNNFEYLKKMLTNGKDSKNDKKDTKKKKKKTKNNKKRKDRPSPSESATTFKVGTKKKGNDGNMWIIIENKNGVKRWSKIK
jgi:hypothetical protein